MDVRLGGGLRLNKLRRALDESASASDFSPGEAGREHNARPASLFFRRVELESTVRHRLLPALSKSGFSHEPNRNEVWRHVA